jgi:ABC-type multidrug transport system ATPase subunit
MTSKSDVIDGLLDQFQGGLGFVLSGQPPANDSTWSHMVVNDDMGLTRLAWPDITRAVCDTVRDSNYSYAKQQLAHPAKSTSATPGSGLGHLLAGPFVTFLPLKGALLAINLRELRVGFLLTLYGVSDICQSTVSFCLSIIESAFTVIVAVIALGTTATFRTTDMELFFLAYFMGVISWSLLMAACLTLMHSAKPFGLFMALAIIVATGVQVFMDFGSHFPSSAILLIETIFPFGNFMALTEHCLVFDGLRWSNLDLSINGITGWTQFFCGMVNILLTFIICVLFHLCNAPAFGLAPIGWRRLFRPASWRRLCGRRESEKFTGVTVESVTKRYDTGTIAVSNVSVSVERGECLLCVGANGAGKSTLLDMMCGCREPTSGTITACDSDIFVDIHAYQRILSVVFQENALIPTYTAREHIELCAKLLGKSEEETRVMVDMFASMFKMRDFMNNASENLSGGSKRKLCLAMALAKDPQVLVCDEPCAGIDVEARQIIWRAISSYPEMTSFISVHSIDEAESMTSRILVMSQGKVKFLGSPAEMRDEFKCGYEVAILEDAPISDIFARVSQAVPEVRISPDHPNVLLLPADLRVLAALEAIGDLQYLVHLDSIEITIRKMIEDDELQENVGHLGHSPSVNS